MKTRLSPQDGARLWRNTLGLGAAQAVALVASALAALLYARALDAAGFAVWAGALALARALLMLLDGGLKTALVRREAEPDANTLRRLRQGSAWLALLIAVVLAAVLALAVQRGALAAADAFWLWGYPAAYLLPYPPMFGALARLERAQCFQPVARAEAGSVLLEFVLPALLLVAGVPAWMAFVGSALLARTLRSLWIVRAARALSVAPSAPAGAAHEIRPLATVLRDGLGVQAIALVSMLRDHLHLLLVAPWFGAEWAGRYAFAFTACTLASQVFVQTAARVGLPLLRAADPAARWALMLSQVRQLAIVTLPPLALLPALLAAADGPLWDGRWAEAIALLPWLVWRMWPSVATTPLGALMLVAGSPWAAARTHAVWTLVELGVALLMLAWLGPVGLAVAAALTAWVGVALFAARVQPGRGWARELLGVLLLRPAVLLALPLAATVAWRPDALVVALLLLPLCGLAEPSWRRALRAWWQGRRASRLAAGGFSRWPI